MTHNCREFKSNSIQCSPGTMNCLLTQNLEAQEDERRETPVKHRFQQNAKRLALPAKLFLALLFLPCLAFAGAQTPTQVGWVERVALYPGGFILPAKVDTGAVSCSLHCPNPTMYEKGGSQWVKFQIKDADGKDVTIDRQVVGTRRIKRHYGDFQMRPVIRMGVCLGSLYRETDVNLVDRTGFEYPMLIGRNFMDKEIVVNPSVKNTVEPRCSEKK